MSLINIAGKNKALVLTALYNHAKPLGMGFLQYVPGDMTEAQATDILKQTHDFDYLAGRVMKVNLQEDTFDPYLYNRDNGEGAAERALESILKS